MDNILERLRNGETLDDIANEFTNKLNEAQNTYLKEQADKAAKDQKAKEKEAATRELAEHIAAYIKDYCDLDMTADDIVKIINDTTVSVNKICDSLETLPLWCTPITEKKNYAGGRSFMDKVLEFLG